MSSVSRWPHVILLYMLETLAQEACWCKDKMLIGRMDNKLEAGQGHNLMASSPVQKNSKLPFPVLVQGMLSCSLSAGRRE